MNQEAVEAAIATASTKASYGTAGVMGLTGWLTSDIVFGIIGVVIGLGTWAVNAYYRRKENKRNAEAAAQDAELKRRADARSEREHQLRMHREYGTGWDKL